MGSPILDRTVALVAVAMDRLYQGERWVESHQRLQAALKVNEIGTWFWDGESRRIRSDANASSLLGIAARDPDWQTMLRHILLEDQPLVEETVSSAMQSPSSFRICFRSCDNEENERWFELKGSSHFTSAGLLVALPCALIDVTQRKRFEQQLQAARLQAEAANRARGLFLANVSHEIRTPMTVILGSAAILREGAVSDSRRLQLLDSIQTHGEFLSAIVEDILDLSKIDAGKVELSLAPADIRELLSDVAGAFRPRCIEKQLELTMDVDSQLPSTLLLDAVRFRQILLNIVGNAVKFTQQGGVSLSASFDGTDSKLLIQVADTGMGIPEEFLDKIFQPFIQVSSGDSRAFGGAGLGLAICQRLVEAMGGNLSVCSREGHGSVFTISVLAHRSVESCEEESPGSLQITAPSNDDANISCVHLLLIDDRVEIQLIVDHFVRQSGGEVTSVSSGREAIEWLSASETEGSSCLDGILLDLQMPDMDGWETARKIRERGYRGPIIALTASSQQLESSHEFTAIFSGLIPKPIQPQQMIAKLSRLLRSTKS